MIKALLTSLLSLVLTLCCLQAGAQIEISGTVYDITRKTPIDAVSVLTTSGRGTSTDSFGHYTIIVRERDSIYFSYLNRATPKYAVAAIQNTTAFDISILTKVQQLPSVFVKQRNYKLDSLQNRMDYKKVFDFKKPGISTSMNPTPGSLGVGLDLDAFINMFKFRKNKRMMAFQRRLLLEEKEKYVTHKFSKQLVRKLTGLESPELDTFMINYRPTYAMVSQFNDLELGQFIIEAYKYYKAGIKVNRDLFFKDEDE